MKLLVFLLVFLRIYPIYEGEHDAIISEEEFMLAKSKRERTGFKHEKTHSLDHEHILSGILKCPVCGGAMYANVNRKKKQDGTYYRDFFYYACKHRIRIDGHHCDYHRQWGQDRVNAAVEETIKKMVNNPKFKAAIRDKIGAKVDTTELEKERSDFRKQLQQVLGEIPMPAGFLLTKKILTIIINMTYSCRVDFNKIHMGRERNEDRQADCITSYDLKKLDEMYAYYADKGCEVLPLEECMRKRRLDVMRLDGFGLLAEDMGKMIRFYRDVLGFEIKEAEDTSNVYLVKDGTLFLLYGRKDFEKMTNRRYEYVRGLNGHSEIALYVDTFDEVDAAFKNAIENGATPVLEPELEPWGQRTCYIADPEGNLIEIGSWNKPFEDKDAGR